MADSVQPTCVMSDSLHRIPDSISVSFLPKAGQLSTKSLQRGLNYFQQGYIHDIRIAEAGDPVKVTAKCWPSMRKSQPPHKLMLDIDDTYSQVTDAYCSCKAGFTAASSSSAMGLSSTPLEPRHFREQLLRIPETMSGISDAQTSTGAEMSGIEVLSPKQLTVPGAFVMKPTHESTAGSREIKTKTDIHFVECTVSASDDGEVQEEDDSYEPSVNITLHPKNMEELENVSFGDIEFEEEDGTEKKVCLEKPGPDIQKVTSRDDAEVLQEDEVFLVYKSCLLQLAKQTMEDVCPSPGCDLPLSLNNSVIGSAVYLKWVCANGHQTRRWCSQPVFKSGLHAGDLLSSFCVLASGNNFAKVALFAKFLQLHFVGRNTFHAVQRTYCVPTIERFWVEHQRELLAGLAGKDVVVAGDGRMDSPGHCAQYCTYSMMDVESKKVLSIQTVDKRETERKSPLMEKRGFQKAMQDLKTKNVSVVEVVTDQHLQITALIKKEYPEVKHSFDVWHVAKGITKKVNSLGQDRNSRDILRWAGDISNHFFHCCRVAEDINDFRSVWFGMVHHVVNEHRWKVPYAGSRTECSHGPLVEETEREAKWLVKGSPAHKAVLDIAYDKRFLNKIPHLITFRSTAELENFNMLILMYASKRFAYTPTVYKARNLLAALDNNFHADRAERRTSDGKLCFHRVHNKKTNRWTVRTYRETKTYSYIPSMIQSLVRMRMEDVVTLQGAVLNPDDPRQLAPTIAPTNPPPTEEIAALKKSR